MKNTLLNLYLQYRLLLYPLIVGLASLILIILLIIPQLRSLLTGQENLDSALNRLNSLDAKAVELTNLDRDDLNFKLKASLASLPTDKDTNLVIGVFKDLGFQSQMNLVSLQFTSSTGQSEKQEGFIARVEVIGNASQLVKLINNIESSPRVMRVKNVEVSSSSKGTVNASITVLAYFVPPPKSLEPIDSALPKLSDKDQAILNNLLNNTVSATASFAEAIILPSGKADPFQ